MNAREVFDRFVSVIFPQRCLQCDDAVAFDDFLCAKCRFVPVGMVELLFANRLSGIAGVLEYSGERRSLVLKIKDGPPARVCEFFAGEMFKVLAQHWAGVGFDAVVPVPTTNAKMLSRGFNQVDLLARPLGKLAEIPVLPNALRREESSKTQHELSRGQREENARLSYKINRPDAVAGQVVLLLDDLLTTGYTISACADCLLDAGAAKVYALCAAATPLH